MIIYSNSFTRMLYELASDYCKVAKVLHDHKVHVKDDEINYITMRGNMISYLPNGKEHRVNDNGRWVRDGRQEGKPGRIVRKLLSDTLINSFDISDQDIEKFVNSLLAYVMSNGDGENDDNDRIDIVVCNGDFIKTYYNNGNYSPNASGNLTNSCMANRPSSYFSIYSDNHDVVSMVVALDKNRLVVGRALLWRTDEHGLCMDTIYASDSVRPMFINFAKQNGFRYKSNQSCHHHQFDMLGDERSSQYERVSVSISHTEFGDYPYVDSLYFLDMANCKLCNYEPNEYRELRNTDGSYTDRSNEVEAINGDMIDEDDAYYLEYYGPNGRVRGYAHFDDVVTDVHGTHVLTEDTEYVNGYYYLRNDDDIVWVDCESEYMHVDDVVFLECGDAVPCDQAVETRDGLWIHKDDAETTEDGETICDGDAVRTYDDKIYHEDNCVRLYDRQWAHEDDELLDRFEGYYFITEMEIA